jgi:hypothetical protein
MNCGKPLDGFKAQRGQDMWVLDSFRGTQRDGGSFYYVDLAAQEPACNSNTFALDRRGWRGLCIEASHTESELLRNFRSCTVVEAAIDSTVRNATFVLLGGYGGLVGEGLDNFNRHPRGLGRPPATMDLTTRTLLDVLSHAHAPTTVDYLSLDVEGAENRVLTTDVLLRYTFLTLTVERPSPRLSALLFAHGTLHGLDPSSTHTWRAVEMHPLPT